MASPAKAPQASIYIKVVAGNDLRNHLSKPPMPSILLRISVAGQAQPEVYKTTPVPAGNSPKWNQEFILPIPDPTKSQLECTLWDESDPSPQKYSNFLGEVLLNVAKLAPYKGTYIEQSFQVRQGKTIQTENQASGSLKLGLRLDLPLEAGAVPAPAPVPHVARDVEGEKKQEEEEALRVKAEAERKAAELKAKEEELLKKEEEAKNLQAKHDEEAKKLHGKNEEAKAKKLHEEEQARIEKLHAEAEAAHKAKAEADAKAKAEAEHAAKAHKEKETAQAENLKVAEQPTAPPAASARVVIAVIEGQSIVEKGGYVAQVRVNGPSDSSVAQTKIGKGSDPFWNEKFVFGVASQDINAASVAATLLENGMPELAIRSVPISLLLQGQRMSLPTVNQGKDIFCVDSWFDLLPPAEVSKPADAAALAAGKTAGKAQIHLRMTYIPAADEAPASPAAPRILAHQPTREKTPIAHKGGPSDVGIVLGAHPDEPGAPAVASLVPRGSAEVAGVVKVGDKLLDVDGYDVGGRPLDDVKLLLSGEPNSPVTIILQRVGQAEPVVATLIRGRGAPVPEPSAAPKPAAPPAAAPVFSSETTAKMERSLRQEFSKINFLWGEQMQDPVAAALVSWKDELLYGCTAPDLPNVEPDQSIGLHHHERIWPESYRLSLSGTWSAAMPPGALSHGFLGPPPGFLASQMYSGAAHEQAPAQEWQQQLA